MIDLERNKSSQTDREDEEAEPIFISQDPLRLKVREEYFHRRTGVKQAGSLEIKENFIPTITSKVVKTHIPYHVKEDISNKDIKNIVDAISKLPKKAEPWYMYRLFPVLAVRLVGEVVGSIYLADLLTSTQVTLSGVLTNVNTLVTTLLTYYFRESDCELFRNRYRIISTDGITLMNYMFIDVKYMKPVNKLLLTINVMEELQDKNTTPLQILKIAEQMVEIEPNLQLQCNNYLAFKMIKSPHGLLQFLDELPTNVLANTNTAMLYETILRFCQKNPMFMKEQTYVTHEDVFIPIQTDGTNESVNYLQTNNLQQKNSNGGHEVKRFQHKMIQDNKTPERKNCCSFYLCKRSGSYATHHLHTCRLLANFKSDIQCPLCKPSYRGAETHKLGECVKIQESAKHEGVYNMSNKTNFYYFSDLPVVNSIQVPVDHSHKFDNNNTAILDTGASINVCKNKELMFNLRDHPTVFRSYHGTHKSTQIGTTKVTSCLELPDTALYELGTTNIVSSGYLLNNGYRIEFPTKMKRGCILKDKQLVASLDFRGTLYYVCQPIEPTVNYIFDSINQTEFLDI